MNNKSNAKPQDQEMAMTSKKTRQRRAKPDAAQKLNNSNQYMPPFCYNRLEKETKKSVHMITNV